MNINLDDCLPAYEESSPYSLDNRIILSGCAQRILQKAHGDSLLELGLGHGHTATIFSKEFSRHLILDGSKKIIDHFQKAHPEFTSEIQLTYFENFDTCEKFDVILVGFVLEHVDSPEKILNRYKRFLKPGGKLFISVPNALALNKRLGYEAGLIKDMFQLSEADISQGHQRLYSTDTLKNLITNCGLTLCSLEGVFLKPITTNQILQLQLSNSILEAMNTVAIAFPELSVGLLAETMVNEKKLGLI